MVHYINSGNNNNKNVIIVIYYCRERFHCHHICSKKILLKLESDMHEICRKLALLFVSYLGLVPIKNC